MTSFLQMVWLYLPTLVVTVLSAPTLAVLGLHLAERDKAMQTLCANQAALLGVLVGLVVVGDPLQPTIIPTLVALLFSLLTYSFSDRVTRDKKASKNTIYAGIYLVLSATSYFLSAVVPMLENHLSQIFFGDLVTLPSSVATQLWVLMAVAFAGLIYFQRIWFCDSFEEALFGESVTYAKVKFLFQLGSSFLLAVAVQHLGLLYTTSLLFLSSSILYSAKRPSLLMHLALCIVASTIAATAGLLLSLQFTRLPTVPTIILVLTGVSFLLRLTYRTQMR